MKPTSQLDRTLTFVEKPPSLSKLPKSQARLTKLWQNVCSFIGDAFSLHSEPCIREITNGKGVSYWTVHDPVSGTRLRFDSTKEIMVWLEQRYYKHQRERNW